MWALTLAGSVMQGAPRRDAGLGVVESMTVPTDSATVSCTSSMIPVSPQPDGLEAQSLPAASPQSQGRKKKPLFCKHMQIGAALASLYMPTLSTFRIFIKRNVRKSEMAR